jgi:hypothetical protein
MGIGGTLLLYSVFGGVVAAAMVLRHKPTSPSRTAISLVAWTIFWPLFAPLLFGGETPLAAVESRRDELDPRLSGAQERLLSALCAAAEGAPGVLATEIEQLRKVGGALASLGRKRRDMERLMASPEFNEPQAQAALAALAAHGRGDDDPQVQSLRARLRNIDKLRTLLERTHNNLERTLCKMEELSSQLILLRFTEEREREAVELIREIAASVGGIADGLSAAV